MSATTTLHMLYEIKLSVDKLAATTTEDGYFEASKNIASRNFDAYVTSVRDALSTKLAALTAHAPYCAMLEAFMNQPYQPFGAPFGAPLDAVLFRPSASFPMDRHDYHRLWAWRSLWQAAVTMAEKQVEHETYTPRNKFTYLNSMYPRDFDWNSIEESGAPMPPPIPYDNRKRCVRSIVFPISRSWDVEHKIHFATPVTKKGAVKAAEAFLSGPFTRELFATISHDNWICSDTTFEDVVAKRLCIGDLLGGANFLEGFDTKANGEIHLSIGS